MDNVFAQIKTTELKGSTFRSRILDFGDFDISGAEFKIVFKKAGNILSFPEYAPQKVGNTLIIPYNILESYSGEIRMEAWITLNGAKDLALFDSMLISAENIAKTDLVNQNVAVTFGDVVIPVTFTQAIVNIGGGTGSGANGKSAYEIAVLNGFTGTEAEWLISLKGTDGDDFTYEDFTPEQIESLKGPAGKDFEFSDFTPEQLAALKGLDGKSAYQIALDNDFVGTESEWLLSLKGTSTNTETVALTDRTFGYSVPRGSSVITRINQTLFATDEYFKDISWGLLKGDAFGFTFSEFDKNNANLMKDGSASDLSGASGDAMIKFPKCYYLYTDGGVTESFLISKLPFEKAKMMDEFYISMDLPVYERKANLNLSVTYEGGAFIPRSKRVEYPVTDPNLSTKNLFSDLRRTFRNRGAGFDAWSMKEYSFIMHLLVLHRGTYANTTAGLTNLTFDYQNVYLPANSQDGIPRLLTTALNGSLLTSRATPFSIEVKAGTTINSNISTIFGISNFHGLSRKFVDGIMTDTTNHAVFYTEDSENFGNRDKMTNVGTKAPASFNITQMIGGDKGILVAKIASNNNVFASTYQPSASENFHFGSPFSQNSGLFYHTNGVNNGTSFLVFKPNTPLKSVNSKNCIFLGDSITANDITGGNYYSYVVRDIRFKSILNYAISGATWTNTAATTFSLSPTQAALGANNTLWNQMNRVIDDFDNGRIEAPDYIVMVAGINDLFGASRTMGTAADAFATDTTAIAHTALTNVALAMRYISETLKKKFPKVQLIITTPLQKGGTMSDVDRVLNAVPIIKEVALKVGAILIDQANESGISGLMENSNPYYYYDKLHLNAVGSKKVGEFMVNKLKAIV